MTEIRVLTVQQPWAWAILHGGKDIENRSQLWRYRGPLAIQAGGAWSVRGANDARVAAAVGERARQVWLADRDWIPEPCNYGRALSEPGYTSGPFVFGAILGVVELVDVHKATGAPCCPPWGEALHSVGHSPRAATHLVLKDPRPLPEPIPCKGRLGLWRPDEVLAGELARQLAGGAW